MKLISLLVAMFLLFNSIISPVLAAESNSASTNRIIAPEISGESAILIDVKTGQTLYSKNPEDRLQPASTTKIMTALLALEKGNLDEKVTASPTVMDRDTVYGTLIYLEPGEQILLGDLLYALLLNSANDAAVAIAEHLGGSIEDFAELMNERAKAIGAINTTFKNPHGLTEEGHLTTARDLAFIARTAYQNPVFREYVRTKTQVIPRAKEGIPSKMYNENDLLWQDSTVTGIKSGYTAVAQNTLVASASREGRDLIGVILKSPGREIYKDMQALFDYGFANFENRVYKPTGTVLSSIVINDTPVNLILEEPIYYTQALGGINSSTPANPSDSPLDLKLNVLPVAMEFSQIEKGQVATCVEVLSGGKVINVLPLIVDKTVEAPMRLKNIRMGRILSWILIPIALILSLYFYNLYRRVSSARRRRQRMSRRQIYTREG